MRVIRHVRSNRPRAVTTGGMSGGIKLLNNDIAASFNPQMLALGDLNAPCQEKEAVAAVFDLTGFTNFCNQVDAYLAIPRFLNDFINWFFASITDGLTEENDGIRSIFWAELPMLVKFLGDGLLVIWNAQRMTEAQICRLTVMLYSVCYTYQTEFYPRINRAVNKPPSILRCGVARGKVFAVGSGSDYVGHCINNASRLSHLGPLTFCFPHHGFRVSEYMPEEWAQYFEPKAASIRGVGDSEMIWVVREEFARLPERVRLQYRSLENALN